MTRNQHCLGVPNHCDYFHELITRALNGHPDRDRIDQLRTELANCPSCLQVLDTEIRFKMTMSQACRESAPVSLQIRITESLRRVVLDDLDVQDF